MLKIITPRKAKLTSYKILASRNMTNFKWIKATQQASNKTKKKNSLGELIHLTRLLGYFLVPPLFHFCYCTCNSHTHSQTLLKSLTMRGVRTSWLFQWRVMWPFYYYYYYFWWNFIWIFDITFVLLPYILNFHRIYKFKACEITFFNLKILLLF